MRGAELQSAASSPVAQRSPWHSPVPYLFGGLAAMLGLIAFALLMLACSYWKLSGYLENNEDNERDLESGGDEDSKGGGIKTAPPVLEEKFLVIMAGQENPTYLATPMSSRVSSFGSNTTSSTTITTCSCSTNQRDDDHGEDNFSGELQMTNNNNNNINIETTTHNNAADR